MTGPRGPLPCLLMAWLLMAGLAGCPDSGDPLSVDAALDSSPADLARAEAASLDVARADAPLADGLLVDSRVSDLPGPDAALALKVSKRHTLSNSGSTRGTAYACSNKIVTAGGKRFVAWLDHVSDAKINTHDLSKKTWGAAVLLGKGTDNHGGPALTMDSKGYLHVVFGPHHGPFQYRRSLKPYDASAWSAVQSFGSYGTYPSLVCTPDDTLHLVYRGGAMPRRLVYQRLTGGKWQAPVELLKASITSGYTQYQGTLAVGAKGELHLGFHIYDEQPKGGKFAGYLRSLDGGKSWQTSAGAAVKLPATPATSCFFEQGTTLDMRVGNIALDKQGRPFIFVWHKETSPMSATLWYLDGAKWHARSLLPQVQKAFPGREVGMLGTLTFDAAGTLHIALVTQTPPGGWGHASHEVVLLSSTDAGKTMTALPVSIPDPKLANWLTSMERPYGAKPLAAMPALLFTHGGPGSGGAGGPATEIMLAETGW